MLSRCSLAGEFRHLCSVGSLVDLLLAGEAEGRFQMNPTKKANWVDGFGKSFRQDFLQPPVRLSFRPEDQVNSGSWTFSQPLQYLYSLLRRMILQNLLHHDGVKKSFLKRRKDLAKIPHDKFGKGVSRGRCRPGSEARQEVDSSDGRAFLSQGEGHFPFSTSGVQKTARGKRGHPGEEKLSDLPTTKDEVFFPIGFGTLCFDAVPDLPGQPAVDSSQVFSPTAAHVSTQTRPGSALSASGRKDLKQSLRQLYSPFLFRVRFAASLALFVVASAACGIEGSSLQSQPIAFNHAPHSEKEGSCLVCHSGAEKGARAGLPPLELCVACHYAIIPDHPEVKKVLDHFERQQPILWRKVNVMPATSMVHFKHKPHFRAGIDCSRCHGDVASMAVAEQVINLADMGLCLDCHRETGASIDCLTCHH